MTKAKQILEVLYELWQIRNPQLSPDKFSKDIVSGEVLDTLSNKAIPLSFSKNTIIELTTARNKNLISEQNQYKLQKTFAAFFGLSVGSHAALTWVMQSRPDDILISDFDTVSATNLNRLRFGWSSFGKYKVDILHEQIKDIHPYTNIYSFRKMTKEDLERESNKWHIIVDEVDDFETKLLLRKIAKYKNIPLLSATDVGDNVILDVERYDKDKNTKPFLGRVENIESLDLSKLTLPEKRKLVINLVGFEKNSEEMLDSLNEVGRTIQSWPQLGATATIAGGIIATTIKKIVTGENVKTGRYYISLDDILNGDFNSPEKQNLRASKIANLLEKFNKGSVE